VALVDALNRRLGQPEGLGGPAALGDAAG